MKQYKTWVQMWTHMNCVSDITSVTDTYIHPHTSIPSRATAGIGTIHVLTGKNVGGWFKNASTGVGWLCRNLW